jgi:enoyl-CoA hydratase/carnithine racemase
MGETFVTVERRPDNVALVRLDRPKANALSAAVLAQLHAAATTLHDDPPGAVVLWGGRRIFAAGADIVELGDSGAGSVGASFADALGALASVPRATIAAVNGYALGGGLELALACDFRVCAEDSRLVLPEVLLGVLPGGGGTQRLPRLIGVTSAIEALINSIQFDAESARYRGLLDKVVPTENLRSEAKSLLQESGGAGSWRAQRERKHRPMEIDRSGFTMADLSQGKVSEEKSNALSLSPETFVAFRQYVNEQMANSRKRLASLTAIDVVEKGCILTLNEALQLETREFLRLTASAEARQLISEFFASRKR